MCISALPGWPVVSGMQQRKKEKIRKKKKEKRGEEGAQGDPLHATGSSMPVVSLCVKEDGWLCVEIVGGTWVGDAHDVGAGGRRRRQDLETAWPLRLLAKREWGHVKTMFRCVSRGCANAQDWEKKTKSRLTGSNPHKNANLYRPCVSCVCVALVRACREAREGGMAMAAKRQ